VTLEFEILGKDLRFDLKLELPTCDTFISYRKRNVSLWFDYWKWQNCANVVFLSERNAALWHGCI